MQILSYSKQIIESFNMAPANMGNGDIHTCYCVKKQTVATWVRGYQDVDYPWLSDRDKTFRKTRSWAITHKAYGIENRA